MPRRADPDPNELVVLAVLAEEPLYGYAIARRVEVRSSDHVRLTPGILYPLLKRLEGEGLLTATWETVRSERSPEDADGRRRKWYRISPKGRRRLAQRIDAHREYLRAIEAFLPPGASGAEATA